MSTQELRKQKLDELKQIRKTLRGQRSTNNGEVAQNEDEVVSVLQEQIRKKRKENLNYRKRYTNAESELEFERIKIKDLESELEKIRTEIRKKEKSNFSEDNLSQVLTTKQKQKDELVKASSSLKTQKAQLKSEIKTASEELQKAKTNYQVLSQQLNSQLAPLLHQELPSYSQDISQSIQQKESLLHQLSQLHQEYEQLEIIDSEKLESIEEMQRTIQDLQTYNTQLQEALSNYNQNTPADPPPDQAPIIEVQGTRNLVSDVGSSAYARREEAKSHASPDPLENLLHTSTGETLNEPQISPVEELLHENGIDTPRREDRKSHYSSRSSTPHRYSYQHFPFEQPEEDFFAQNPGEFSSVPRSLFD